MNILMLSSLSGGQTLSTLFVLFNQVVGIVDLN